MKNLLKILALSLLTCFLLQAQSPAKSWQIQFDFGGDWDDARNIIVDSENDYVITGVKWPRNAPNTKAALASVKAVGSVNWKWTDTASYSWTETSGLAEHSDSSLLVAISHQAQPAKLSVLSKDGKLRRDFSVSSGTSAVMGKLGNRTMVVSYGGQTDVYILNETDSLIRAIPNITGYVSVQALVVAESLCGIFGINYSSTGDFNTAAVAHIIDWQGNVRWSKKVNDCSRASGTVDNDGSVYFGFTVLEKKLGQTYPDQILTTAKYDSAGNEIWRKKWDGDPISGTRLVNWTNRVISYPGGGCIHLGSIAKNGNTPDANLTDFGAIAYDSSGNVRWKLRFEAHAGWDRNDLWGAAWDRDNYLVLLGSTFKKWDVPPDDHRYLVVTKWSVPGVTTAVREYDSPAAPNKFRLEQNYPNPFNPSTKIRFSVSARSNVRLSVFDILGRQMTELANGTMEIGTYETEWNADGLPSGIYILKLESDSPTGKFASTRRMILLK